MTESVNDNINPEAQKHNQGDVFAIWQDIQNRISRACARSGREVRSVRLLGASKTVSAWRLQQFFAVGLNEVGENYVQEGVDKKVILGQNRSLRWHLIGALQSNKAKIVVREFDLIHSVDRLSLAQAINKAAREIGKTQKVLLQVNIGGEATKAGCAPSELKELAHYCRNLEHLRVCGLMCLPPYDDDPEKTRPYFRQLRDLRDELQAQNSFFDKGLNREFSGELSMGMSDDFEVAIEEGATIIRLGTVLFGRRDKIAIKNEKT